MIGQLYKISFRETEKLESFSPWLAKYHWYGGDNYIELPGQYTGNASPNNTIKIVKFHETVKIFRSLRRPIKISFDCSDGKSRSFLVKYGEDLRQDDRIQQILNLMADQMNSDKNCNQQRLTIRTYKVIPMNIHCGIISWIDNSETVHKLIINSQSMEMKDYHAINDYKCFVMKEGKTPKKQNANVIAAIHYTQKQVSNFT